MGPAVCCALPSMAARPTPRSSIGIDLPTEAGRTVLGGHEGYSPVLSSAEQLRRGPGGPCQQKGLGRRIQRPYCSGVSEVSLKWVLGFAESTLAEPEFTAL